MPYLDLPRVDLPGPDKPCLDWLRWKFLQNGFSQFQQQIPETIIFTMSPINFIQYSNAALEHARRAGGFRQRFVRHALGVRMGWRTAF